MAAAAAAAVKGPAGEQRQEVAVVLLLLGGRVELWEVGAKDNWAGVRQRHLVVAWNTMHAFDHHDDGQAADNEDQDEVEGREDTCNASHEHKRVFRLSTTQCCNSH